MKISSGWSPGLTEIETLKLNWGSDGRDPERVTDLPLVFPTLGTWRQLWVHTGLSGGPVVMLGSEPGHAILSVERASWGQEESGDKIQFS